MSWKHWPPEDALFALEPPVNVTTKMARGVPEAAQMGEPPQLFPQSNPNCLFGSCLVFLRQCLADPLEEIHCPSLP